MPDVKKKRLLSSYGIVLLFVAMVTVGVVMAIVSKNVESRVNTFTFSSIDITVEEPEWEDEEEIVYPGKVYSKDPLVHNNSKQSLYVFLEVKVPVADVDIVGEDKVTVSHVTDYELLRYDVTDADWVKIEDNEYSVPGYHVYVYAYTQKLPAFSKTSSLFDEVQFCEEITEGQPSENYQFEMPVAAYAVQSEMLGDSPDADSLKDAFRSQFRTQTDQS